MNEDLIKTFLASRVFALVGASDNPEKYGNIILKNMTAKGYSVLPVNPAKDSIEGIACHADIASLPGHVKFLNFVIPPQKAIKMMQSVKDRGIEIVWFQPGAYNDELIEECRRLDIKTIHDGSCIMVCAASGC